MSRPSPRFRGPLCGRRGRSRPAFTALLAGASAIACGAGRDADSAAAHGAREGGPPGSAFDPVDAAPLGGDGVGAGDDDREGANHRPSIEPIAATVAGQVVQGVFPGATVELSARASDPDGDPLRATWSAAQGAIRAVGAGLASWTLPATQGTFAAYLTVDDGRRGVAVRRVTVRVRTDPTVLFTGDVRDDAGQLVAGATVAIGAASTWTDREGRFALTAPERPSYLLHIGKLGHVDRSLRLAAPGRAWTYVLARARAQAIRDPRREVVIEDRDPSWPTACARGADCRRPVGRVIIPAGAIDRSRAPVGGLTAYIATLDPTSEPLPGDQTGIDRASSPRALFSYGALFVEIRDAAGVRYDLAPGRSARIEIPIAPSIARGSRPSSTGIWMYDAESGLWEARGSSGVRAERFYAAVIPRLGVVSAAIGRADPACLYVDLEDSSIPGDADWIARLRVSTPAGRATRVHRASLDAARAVFFNLPSAASFSLGIVDRATGAELLRRPLVGATGRPWGGVGDPGANEPGCAIQRVDRTDLAPAAGAWRVPARQPRGSLDAAQAYYRAIDPAGRRDTLGGFWEANGFDDEDGSVPGEPGGAMDARRAPLLGLAGPRCREDRATGDLACYATTYGRGRSPGDADLAAARSAPDAVGTVAIEYTTGPGGRAVARFYAYSGGEARSPRAPSADIDGAEPRFVPELCLACHREARRPPPGPVAAGVHGPDPARRGSGGVHRPDPSRRGSGLAPLRPLAPPATPAGPRPPSP